jgi:Transposase IS66 family
VIDLLGFCDVGEEPHPFEFTPDHSSDAVDDVLSGYQGFLVADAHVVYDHLYARGDVVEVNCWAHARRYFFKALDSDPERRSGPSTASSSLHPSAGTRRGNAKRSASSSMPTRSASRSTPAAENHAASRA